MHGFIPTLCCLILITTSAAAQPAKPFRIRVLDDATGRGVPLVELITVNNISFVTDNAGQVAYQETGQFGGDVFFTVKCQGYEPPKAPFGYEGIKLPVTAGGEGVIRLKRTDVAERVCRLTGAERYHDSVLLGDSIPEGDRITRGGVLGQDTIQAATYRGKHYWFWGDTNRAAFPLGLFRTAGATTPIFVAGRDSIEHGLPYEYFIDASTGFARAMIPYSEQKDGVIWIGGVTVVRDSKNVDRMVCHYSRRKGLAEQLEHGIAVYNDERKIFEPLTHLPLEEKWRFIENHPVVHEDGGKTWLVYGEAAANIRVPATYEAVIDPKQYEAFTCLKAGSTAEKPLIERGPNAAPAWRWDRDAFPVTGEIEDRLVQTKQIQLAEARLSPEALGENGKRLRFSSGTVRFNKHRNCWIVIGGQFGGTKSFLGEVWYSEGPSPTGPFAKAVKIVSHDGQSFYNVCHHDVLDEQGGRIVSFEGTYTNSFTKNVAPTPRYEYNQVLYRLDLDAEPLKAVRADTPK